MSSSRTITRGAAVPWALRLVLLLACATRCFAWDYGNGRHGSFVLTTNATVEQLYQAVRLTSDPAQFNPADSNAIPNFQNLTITNGATLTANAWNGSSGGWIVLKVEATLTVASGATIAANGIGYRGGFGGQQGESFAGYQGYSAPWANYGGGGGGYMMGNGYCTSGGGGGYGSGGGTGTGHPYDTYNGVNYDGVGGGTYGDPSLATVYLGSGGGGGEAYRYPPFGGSGGGAIVLSAGALVLNGHIQANGNDYTLIDPSIYSGAGGGSGGSILLRVVMASVGSSQMAATGGNGNFGGGGGGVGRIALAYARSFSGVTTPAAYTVQDTNSDNTTAITQQPLAQTNFWSSNAVINVGIAGYPPFVFQWYFNAAPLPGATNQALAFSSLDLTNQGSYYVTVANAVMTVTSSNAFLTVLDGRDFDGDGIPNYWEEQYGLNPNNPNDATNHPPGDRLTYLQKYLYGLNPLTTDTDGDGISDYDEIFIYHSNPLSANTAGDGIPDGWKAQHGLNPLVSDANNDAGFDGVSYLQVYQYNLAHPTTQLDPNRPFTVGTGLSNYEIVNNGQHTNRFYYDHEDRLLGMETSRGISIAYAYDGNGNLTRQTVLSRASETNGLPVLWCFLNGLTNNPNPYADSDGDGWSNYQEWMAGTNPNDTNSRPTVSSGVETAPYAVVLPSTNALGGIAVVTVRLWDDEGNSSTPFLQYQILGTTNWQDAAVYGLDGGPYSSTNRVAALPSGINHTLAWNAMNDLGANVVTNVLLHVRAQDFMLVGDWSLPTPFLVNTLPPTTVSIGPSHLLPGGQFQLAISSGVLGQSYVVLASTNLVDWLPISGYIFTNPPITIIDPDATNFAWRFYRIGPLSWASSVTKLASNAGESLSSNDFNLTLYSLPGLNYEIEASTDLVNWTIITGFSSTNSTLHFSDPLWTNYPSRFYRLRSP